MSSLNWKRSIGQIVLANKGCRLLGFTAVRLGAGVSTICRQVARLTAASGAKTLIITMPAPNTSPPRHSGDKSAAASALRAAIVPSVHGYDLLSGQESDAVLGSISMVQLRDALDNDFDDYDRVVLDLPPVCDDTGEGLIAATVATICDRVLLICLIGKDNRGDVAEAAALLRSSGATLSGVISNEYQRVDPLAFVRKSGLLQAAQ